MREPLQVSEARLGSAVQLAVSAGQRGLQLVLSGPDLIRATGAELAAICKRGTRHPTAR